MLRAACPQLNLPPDRAMLVIDNVPVTGLRLNAAGGVADGSVNATLHDAGIHNNSVLTAVASQK